MAKTFGFSGVTEFALAVESMTQEERRNCLELFYRKRAEKLKELGEIVEEDVKPKNELGVKDEAETVETKVKTEKVDSELEDVKDVKGEENVKMEDVKPSSPVIKWEIEQAAPLTADVKRVKKEASPAANKRASMTIWISDDDETDEL
ncbi:hypothetical protein PC116_g32114 [Phytophthora cactorum]|nr:hypothetical protein PC116_g32114 [Phytophthora cactorum]